MTAPRPHRAGIATAIAAVFFLLAVGVRADTGAYRLYVDGLSCPFCAYGIEKRLREIDGVEEISIDVAAGRVEVRSRSGATLQESDLREAVDKAGFSLRRVEHGK